MTKRRRKTYKTLTILLLHPIITPLYVSINSLYFSQNSGLYNFSPVNPILMRTCKKPKVYFKIIKHLLILQLQNMLSSTPHDQYYAKRIYSKFERFWYDTWTNKLIYNHQKCCQTYGCLICGSMQNFIKHVVYSLLESCSNGFILSGKTYP